MGIFSAMVNQSFSLPFLGPDQVPLLQERVLDKLVEDSFLEEEVVEVVDVHPYYQSIEQAIDQEQAKLVTNQCVMR